MHRIPKTLWSRRGALAGGAAALAVGAVGLRSTRALARNRVEEPEYTIITRPDDAAFDYEIRQYAPRIIAETTVIGDDPRAASNQGFRVLANYIFGGNKRRAEIAMTAPVGLAAAAGSDGQKIAMTAPVTRQAKRAADGQRAWIVTFTMPTSWTMKTLPVPNDARVRLRELPGSVHAARRFSGSPGRAKVKARTDEFVAHLRAAGYGIENTAPVYARYDPPWTPSFLRRNEVLVKLTRAS